MSRLRVTQGLFLAEFRGKAGEVKYLSSSYSLLFTLIVFMITHRGNMIGGVSVMNAGDIYTSQRKTFNPLIYLKNPYTNPNTCSESHRERQ